MDVREMNRWAVNASALQKIERSKWNQPFEHKTTMMSGKLVPIMCKEVLSGDTFKVDVQAVVRSITPAVPVMDNSFLDLFFFYVPNRLCTKQPNTWAAVTGQNFSGPWYPSTETTLATSGDSFQFNRFSSSGIEAGSLLNYLGVPVLTAAECGAMSSTKYVNSLKVMGYYRIWDEWFRDESTQSPLDINLNFSSYISSAATRAGLKDVNKIKGDPFCGVLPAPQRGPSVQLPLGTSAPVLTSSVIPPTISGTSHPALQWLNTMGGTLANNGFNVTIDSSHNTTVNTLSSGVGTTGVFPANLYADLSQATAATINQIRLAFALQRYAEKSARGGGRYRSWVLSMYGVNIADSIVQVPEYLGGFRQPLNITQVLQTSETGSTSPLGTTGAFSNTAFARKGIVKSFSENGFLYCMACIRTQQSYSQGLSRDWYRLRITDWYTPTFAHIGEQPVYKSELYLKGNPTLNEGAVFGYQEAWFEYRYNPTLVTGFLAPDANDATLTAWTYTNKFTSNPVLNSSWMVQPSSQIDDTLVVQNSNYQFICDFYFPMVTARPMPLFSIPGLLDHF